MREPKAPPRRRSSLAAPIAGMRRLLSIASFKSSRGSGSGSDPKDASKIYPSKILHRLASGLMPPPVMADPRGAKVAAHPAASFKKVKGVPESKGDPGAHQASSDDPVQENPKPSWLGRMRQKRQNDNQKNAFGTTFKINVAPVASSSLSLASRSTGPALSEAPCIGNDAGCKIQQDHRRSSASDATGSPGESIIINKDWNDKAKVAARGPTFLPNINTKRSESAATAKRTTATVRPVAPAQDDDATGDEMCDDDDDDNCETNESHEFARFPRIVQASSSSQSQDDSGRQLQLIEHAPPKVLKIGTKTKQRNVSDKELQRLRIHFNKHDRGDGVAPHGVLIAAAGGTGKAASTALLASNKVKVRMRRKSTAERVADGFMNFLDFLRLNYPEATSDDILFMDKIAREMAGEKLFSRQFPRGRQDAAGRQWNSLSDGRELVFLEDLEDFLIQKFNHGDHYEMLKALSTPVFDIYKAGVGVGKEDFMFWMLKLEDEWN